MTALGWRAEIFTPVIENPGESTGLASKGQGGPIKPVAWKGGDSVGHRQCYREEFAYLRTLLLRFNWWAVPTLQLGRIVAARLEGVTAADSLQAAPSAAQGTVLFHSLNEIGAASRLKATMAANERA